MTVWKSGRIIKRWLVEYITSGLVVALVLRGNHAVEVARKLVGDTIPLFAEPGTVRGDFSVDSPDLTNKERRAVYNLVHASETAEETEREISLWFGELWFKGGVAHDPRLEETYQGLKKADKRRAAEVAYVLAVLKKEKGNIQEARKYGTESIKLFKELNIQTLKDAGALYNILNGVVLPDYIHEGVVRDRLLDLNLQCSKLE